NSICYGHAGDGNLHINIIKENMPDEQWKNVVPKGVKEIFELTVSLGGTLSGEHGIGWVQRNFMPIVFNKIQLQLKQVIITLYCQRHIMSLRKIFRDNNEQVSEIHTIHIKCCRFQTISTAAGIMHLVIQLVAWYMTRAVAIL